MKWLKSGKGFKFGKLFSKVGLVSKAPDLSIRKTVQII